jgi:hypothetical protein
MHHLVLDLAYGEDWVTTVLRSTGARLELEFELVDPEAKERVQRARDENRKLSRLHQALRHAMNLQFEERLPFDEPKTEIGQEDGKVRRQWRYAYLEGRKSYEVNGDRYRVFSREGTPLVPQVCIDFVLDTFERASGTWWGRGDGPRERKVGRLDFYDFDRSALRRTKYFVEFARQHTEWFEVRDVPKKEQVQLGYKPKFFSMLASHVEHYQPGDIVFIEGFTPWDEEHRHTHAFIIYENDPVTRVPILIAGNPGPANLWSWETEARRTPKRAVRWVVRPKVEWLEAILGSGTDDESPPILVPRVPHS